MKTLMLALVFASLMACDEHEDSEGMSTGAVCPTSNPPTYESFGRSFMESYCTRCHSSTLSGAARNGAPTGHDFDTELGVLAVAEHVDENAAAGPNGTNEIMPPSGPRPTLEERKQLGAWLACELALAR